MTRGEEPCLALLRLLAGTARGPKRDAAFALWLTARVAEDMMTAGDLSERAQRRRVAALEKRVSSLSLPPSFRRALAAGLAHMRDPRPEAAQAALTQLAAPVGDTLGAEAAGAVQRLVRGVRLPEKS
ncbi:MAG TPA: hypothetical protein VF862_11365 [Gemmatimonadales bacterium]